MQSTGNEYGKTEKKILVRRLHLKDLKNDLGQNMNILKYIYT